MTFQYHFLHQENLKNTNRKTMSIEEDKPAEAPVETTEAVPAPETVGAEEPATQAPDEAA